MQDRWSRSIEHRTLPTPEQARELYGEFAGEALRGVLVFDRMEEVAQRRLIADTAFVIARTVSEYEGHYRSTSPDVVWSALNQAYKPKTADESAFGRFRRDLGKSARIVHNTIFAMLEAGVKTRAELANIRQAPMDELRGLRDVVWHRTEEDVSVLERIDDLAFPRPEDLPEL